VGAIVSSIAIGGVVFLLDTPTEAMRAANIQHAIGSAEYPAPQATLMATLARGILSFNLDWQFVLVGVFIAIMVELCGVRALAFAIGLYLPLKTTLPIFIGGAARGIIDWRAKRRGEVVAEDDLSRGNLFATGLIAGGAITGVLIAILAILLPDTMKAISLKHGMTSVFGEGLYMLVGVLFFFGMIAILFRTATRK